MNCLNHPDVAAAAYCQNCGKPLCTACIRSVGGVVYCEPCLAARLSGQPGAAEANLTGLHAHPVLAGLLGFIPGVGAMYNGQFVKALAHVLIFAVFVSLSDKSFIFGMLVAAWVFYQVFDAAQTAKARRDGLPLPNPFGLNDLGTRLGMAPPPASSPYVAGFTPPPGSSVPGGANPNPDPGRNPGVGGPYQQAPAYTASYTAPPTSGIGAPGMPSGYTEPLAIEPRGQRHPFGAIVLIVIGLLLLLHTLGIFEDEWIGRAWPIIIIGVGAWLFYRRTRDLPRGGTR
jgi:TM2 domain-containing membrane protein YozV